MENLAPGWRKLLKNLGWYAATLVVLTILLSFTRISFILIALWGVGLVWGGVLAFQFSQLLFGRDEIVIGEERLRAYLEQALSYKTQINSAIKATSSKADRIHLDQLATQIDTWVESIADLVRRLSSLRENEVIRRDTKQVPKAIKDLEKRLANEFDTTIRAQLEHTLANRQKQFEALEQLHNTLKRAEIQIENTLSMLGTIYSQILTGQSTSHVADYSRLSADVDEEVRQLQDHLEALREVKLGGA